LFFSIILSVPAIIFDRFVLQILCFENQFTSGECRMIEAVINNLLDNGFKKMTSKKYWLTTEKSQRLAASIDHENQTQISFELYLDTNHDDQRISGLKSNQIISTENDLTKALELITNWSEFMKTGEWGPIVCPNEPKESKRYVLTDPVMFGMVKIDKDLCLKFTPIIDTDQPLYHFANGKQPFDEFLCDLIGRVYYTIDGNNIDRLTTTDFKTLDKVAERYILGINPYSISAK